LFNKQAAKFNDLLVKVPEALRAHQKFKRELTNSAEGEWRYTFFSAEDETRQINIHVFIFNLYVVA
jgi:hypothetical protein